MKVVKGSTSRFLPVVALASALLWSGWAFAQQVTGTLGSPSATTTISGKQLPPPDPKFGGVIKDGALQSKPWWAPRVVPPKGAPNVLLIITDDAGFGVPSTFGGVIPTPTMDRIAKEGLRYNRMFSTALCSPTRAALITGRNHHSAGFGVISEQSTGFPGYNSIIAKDKATIGRILLDNGYSTSWFGKDHNTPAFAASQVGPFDQWPTGMGFEYFYGFVGGDANQWEPNLFRNTTQIYPFQGKPGWNLVTGMADEAIDWMTRMHQTDPSKPIFIKYAPGATHAPHHPTKEWVDKISADEALRRGLEQGARAHLREPETPRRDPEGHQAAAVAEGRAEGVGPADGGGEEALHPPGRGLRRLRRLQRSRDRARDPGLRGPGQARQHADHLHQRRQRHQRRGRAAGHAERSGVLQRRQRAGRRPDEVLRRLGHRANLQPHVGRVVVDVRRAVLVVQAERLAARRHQPEHGRVVAGAHQGQGRPARAVRARHRRRADDPRGRRHPRARDRRRHQADADRGHELRLHLRREERQGAVAAQDPVLRDDGPVGAVPRRLVPEHQGRIARRGRPSARPTRTR